MLTQGGSGIKIEGVQALQVDIVAYQAVYPRGCKVPLPPCLKHRFGLLNIQSEDNCFMLCILAALYSDMITLSKYPTLKHKEMNRNQRKNLKKRMESPKNYRHIIKLVKDKKLIDFTGFEGTFDLNNIGDFEVKNKISVTVYELDPDNKNVKANRFTTEMYDKHVIFLLVENENNAHLILIQDISAFLGQSGYPKAKLSPHCNLQLPHRDYGTHC